MAGTITALEHQKRSSDRVNVYLDGEFGFSLAGSAAAGLKVGTWLSEETIAELKDADEAERAHGRALDYLSYRPRSEAEMRKYLADKNVTEPVIEAVMDRLIRVGLIDDEAFAHFWCDNRARFRPRGRRMLRYELSQKGLSSAAIEAALDQYDEPAALRKAAHAQARRLQHLTADEFRRRLFERLARRGFSYDHIQEILTPQEFPQLNDDETGRTECIG